MSESSIKKSGVYGLFGKRYGDVLINVLQGCCNGIADFGNVCTVVRDCIGINSNNGNPSLVLNQQGEWVSLISGGGGIIYTTLDNLNNNLIPNNQLKAGTTYQIDTQGTAYKDNGIFLKAISTNKLSNLGARIFLSPATYQSVVDGFGNNWLGVWNISLTPSINDLVIWGGLVWKNINGNIGNFIDEYTLDPTEWGVINKDSYFNNEYVELIMTVRFDYTNNWVEWQVDTSNNEIGIDYKENIINYGFAINPCDVTDWNMGDSFFNNKVEAGIYNNTPSLIYDNSCKQIYNNSNEGYISNNSNKGYISNNSNEGYIESNSNTLDISGNSNGGNIYSNSNIGGIYNNSITYSIFDNSNKGNIDSNSNNGQISNNTNTNTISDNSNNGHIMFNSNKGFISNNYNEDYIYFNNNRGEIYNNGNGIGRIEYNSNNGTINNNTGTGGVWIISFNNNNGSISSVQIADVTDTIVNK